jgi:hypothetical protein
MNVFWLLLATCSSFIWSSAVSISHADGFNHRGICYFIITTITRVRQAKFNLQIIPIFTSFKNIRILLKGKSFSKVLLKILWQREKKIEMEFKSTSYTLFTSLIYSISRGVLQKNPQEKEDPDTRNSSEGAFVSFPFSLASLIGLPMKAMFNLDLIRKNFQQPIRFYIVLALEEWQKIKYHLPHADPIISKMFLENFGDDVNIERKLLLIKKLLDLSVIDSAIKDDLEPQSRNKLLIDHVYSFSNIMLIFHIMEYLRHFIQIKELFLMSDPRFEGKVFTLSEWEHMGWFYLALTTLNFQPTTILIAKRRISNLALTSKGLFINPSRDPKDAISEIRFEQVFSKTKGFIRHAAYKEINGEVIFAIYNSIYPENLQDLQDFAEAILDDLIRQLKKGPIPLKQRI